MALGMSTKLLCWIRLVLGWVTYLQMGKPPEYVTSHPGQLSLLPSMEWEMSTGESVMILYGWRVKAGMAHSICGCICGWQIKLCHPSLTCAIPGCFVVNQTL